MESKSQKGCLVLADIAGYTGFLAQTEIDHAHIAISYLLETIVERLSDRLTIVKLEGDAVFAHVNENQMPPGETIMTVIDQTYAAFRDKAAALFKGTTYPCKACQALPSLDLKFMVHHGDYIIQQVAGIKDLLGSDVNLIHRLMKNQVTESTGWRGYALFTQQGLQRVQADKGAFVQQSEAYEHFGDVETYVMDMHPRYAALRNS
jgi:hypothetical protein